MSNSAAISLAGSLTWAQLDDDQVVTPAVVVDYQRAVANAERAQAYCEEHRLRLRPHVKTHKTTLFALLQLGLGAVGVTCQTLDEAGVMAAAGIEDILVSYPVIGADKVRMLAQLARVAPRMSVAADSSDAVLACAEAASQSGAEVGFLVECDTGMGRLGVQTPDQAVQLARLASDTPGVRFRGLMTYPTLPQSAAFFRSCNALLERAGLVAEVISGGGTPTLYHTHEIAGGVVNEVRVGEYLFGDRSHLAGGVVAPDQIAAAVLATVIGRPTATRAILDAGSKTLSSDPASVPGLAGFGVIAEYPDAVIRELSEEHAHVDLSASANAPAIGDRVTVIPNHVCAVINLVPFIAVRHPDGLEMVPVAARRGGHTETPASVAG